MSNGKKIKNPTAVKDGTHQSFHIHNGSDGVKCFSSIILVCFPQSRTLPWDMPMSKTSRGQHPLFLLQQIFLLAQTLNSDPKHLYRPAHPNGYPMVFNKHGKERGGKVSATENHSSLNSPQKKNHRNLFRCTGWQLFVFESIVLGILQSPSCSCESTFNITRRYKTCSNFDCPQIQVKNFSMLHCL